MIQQLHNPIESLILLFIVLLAVWALVEVVAYMGVWRREYRVVLHYKGGREWFSIERKTSWWPFWRELDGYESRGPLESIEVATLRLRELRRVNEQETSRHRRREVIRDRELPR